ncbi:hypothetical protein L2E82_30808 [Cichorium intybus]|uniref:Uncharacterized protein n=1 Tax=Cichorium intybus TaxID=13427 RepID=A0ACB9D1K0_CICIN|nr:hypothetical protein L2E82_30808 [Cichorium intybus]
MAIGTPKSSPVLLLLLTLILVTTPPRSYSFPIPATSFHALFSLSDSLFSRVANLRAARGDISGSIRARSIAQNIEKHSRGFSFYGVMWSLGWDYMKNYAWRDIGIASSEMFGAVSDMNELIRGLSELTRMESEAERVAWVRRNYGNMLTVSKSMFNRLLRVFSRSGPLKDAVEILQAEIVDGGLLKDCLELGSNDLKGVIQILKDVASQYSSTSGKTEL